MQYDYRQICLWTRSTFKSVFKLYAQWLKPQKNQINQKNLYQKIQKLVICNIKCGKEKDERAKIYSVAKEIAKSNLAFCCSQEVRWRNIGSIIITLDTGESFEFHWAGYRKKREAGTGILIRIDPNIEINSPNVNGARVMGIDLKKKRFQYTSRQRICTHRSQWNWFPKAKLLLAVV